MKIVALARAPADPAPAVKLLCASAGFAPAEARMRLAGEAPLVLARLDDGPAEALRAALAEAGLAALAVDARPPGDAERFLVRSFELGADAAVFSPRLGEPMRVPYPSISVILRGLQLSRETQVHTETKRTFSLGKALLTQGLAITKTEKKEVKVETESPAQFLLVYGGPQAAAIYEGEVAFTCLGKDVRPSRLENLNLLQERLRQRAPHAFFDDRLLRFARRVSPFDGGRPTDLAAELLRRAVELGLLPY
ncbi:MAG: hypothetical protein ACYDCL_03475 [Myxococcales bacterium]